MVRPGEFWQHNKSHAIVRVERERGGILSFSILRQGKWVLCQNIWDSEQFAQKFTKLHLREVFSEEP